MVSFSLFLIPNKETKIQWYPKKMNSTPNHRTFRLREMSGAGKSVKQVGDGAQEAAATAGRHLHRGIDFRSYDSESTRSPVNNGPPGVPGVAGADAVGVPLSASAIEIEDDSKLKKFFFFFESD